MKKSWSSQLKRKNVNILLTIMLSGLLFKSLPTCYPYKRVRLVQTTDFGNVKIGNSSYLKIVGISDMCIETNVGCIVILKDVRHVPYLRLNMIFAPIM
jgi:hypothetical protein